MCSPVDAPLPRSARDTHPRSPLSAAAEPRTTGLTGHNMGAHPLGPSLDLARTLSAAAEPRVHDRAHGMGSLAARRSLQSGPHGQTRSPCLPLSAQDAPRVHWQAPASPREPPGRSCPEERSSRDRGPLHSPLASRGEQRRCRHYRLGWATAAARTDRAGSSDPLACTLP